MPYVNIKITREGGPEGKGPSAQQKAELIAGGGKKQVPCLRIEDTGGTRWMYELHVNHEHNKHLSVEDRC